MGAELALLSVSHSPTTTLSATVDAVAANLSAASPPRKLRRIGDRGDSLRRGRLPPPPIAGVARAPAAGSLGGSRDRRRDSRPILQALVTGASGGDTVYSVDTFHAFSSSL